MIIYVSQTLKPISIGHSNIVPDLTAKEATAGSMPAPATFQASLVPLQKNIKDVCIKKHAP